MNFKYNTTGGVVVTEFYKGDKQNTDLFEYAVEKGVFQMNMVLYIVIYHLMM
ncbi:hypothetical protein [Gemella sp. zg-1178]|uniref:hypothetical protein n=1 Tax=Gemella sp. zg-1178 TaxID=2840372 RepID=UPI001C058595|nr:hypothetical protein [Gemella sp. zg-1178]MBU0278077.1 hypothetical protein [Gemella sp. zg-1178]